MKTENVNVHLSLSDGVLCAKICGEIDHHSAKAVREAIDASLCEKEPDKLQLDFSAVSFMDSSGLGLVLGRYTKASEAGIAFCVTGTTDAVRRMFDMAGLERIIDFDSPAAESTGKDTEK